MSVDTQHQDPDAAPAENEGQPPAVPADNGSEAAAAPAEGGNAAPAAPPPDITAARELATRFRMPLVDLAVVGINPEATKEIPLKVLERVGAIPFAFEDDVLSVAITDPENVHAIDELRLATRFPVQFAIAPEEDVLLEIRRLSRANEAFSSVLDDDLVPVDETADDLEAEDGITDGPMVRLVNSIIFQAAEEGASDVHFEPQEDAVVVRFRIDGVLRIAQRVPRKFLSGMVTRLKVLAKLDIAERRKPQDGRISLDAAAAGRLLDVRVATLPTVEGESVTMRLLDKSRTPPTLEELGLTEAMRAAFHEIVSKPTGALFVTGPTGSGKSTSLYAALAELNRPEINVITVEDPVEYRLAGIEQVQINQRAGLTFSTALRSILRSDPDVVMVGEIRDVETAKISIESALTGHFVLSTMHTNDAPGTITRLNEMGVEPFLTASAVSAVLAQRLARKLCSSCCEEYQPGEADLRAARVPEHEFQEYIDNSSFRRAVGCPRCSNTGYRGRVGIFQLLRMNDELESLVASGATRDVLEVKAIEIGMRPLWEDGLAKVREGTTSVEELARVLV
jgi:type IV pilus assembly protein PilB